MTGILIPIKYLALQHLGPWAPGSRKIVTYIPLTTHDVLGRHKT